MDNNAFSYEIVDKQIKIQIASGFDATKADSFLFEAGDDKCSIIYLLHDTVLQLHEFPIANDIALNTMKRQKIMRVEEKGTPEPYAFIAVNKAIFSK